MTHAAQGYAVFGQPIAHSLSPRIHAAFGAQLGIAVDYRAIEAGRADFPTALAAFVRAGGRGANVTLPLKEDALAQCASLTERARRCGSVNTLLRIEGGWHGDSTDGAGLLRDLADHHGFHPTGRRVLLFGAGGAARAAAFALIDAGVAELAIANRTHVRAEALAEALGSRANAPDLADLAGVGAFDRALNATAAGPSGAAPKIPAGLLAAGTLAYDLSSGPAAAPFLAAATAAGAGRCSDGLGMLVEQAAESFFLWHGVRPETAAVFDHLKAEAARAP
jgi:shikimate dehydrogenase